MSFCSTSNQRQLKNNSPKKLLVPEVVYHWFTTTRCPRCWPSKKWIFLQEVWMSAQCPVPFFVVGISNPFQQNSRRISQTPLRDPSTIPTRWCPSSLANLVPITPISRVYGGYIYSYWDYKPTHNWGGTTLYIFRVESQFFVASHHGEKSSMVIAKTTSWIRPPNSRLHFSFRMTTNIHNFPG